MMLNRTAWRYLSSSRRVGPNVLVCVDNPTEWLRARPAVPVRTTSASTNPASCAFFFRRCDRHASSSSSPRSETPPHLPSPGDSKWSMRETSPLTPSTATESSDPRDDDELEGALAEPLLPAEQLSWKDRAKTFASEYGRVGIATHIVLSVMSITVIYTVISCGVDVSGLLKWLGVSTNSAEKDSTAASAGSFVLAYAVYKVAAPLRWPLTFAVTPVVLRALRRRGYMLPKTKANEHRSPRPNAAEHPGSGDDYSSPRH